MTARLKIIGKTFAIEGGAANHPSDRGGKTSAGGLTNGLARKYGWTGSVYDTTPEFRLHVAESEFWYPLRLDLVEILSVPLAEELFDTAYNMGPGRAAYFLQRALNAFNADDRYGSPLVMDGKMGVKTLDMLKNYLHHRPKSGVIIMLRALDSAQGAKYMDFALANPSQRDFSFGWFAKRIENVKRELV